MSHFCYAPLHDIAEVLIVNVVILFSNRPLSTLFEFVLTITKRQMSHLHARHYGNTEDRKLTF